MHSSHRTALTLAVVVFLFAGGMFLNMKYFQTEEDADVLRADTASEDGLECVAAGGNGCSADIESGEILISDDLANSSCVAGTQCVQCSEGYAWEGDVASGDCTNPTACRDAGGEGCTFKLDDGENPLGEQGAFGCTGALTYCVSCDTGAGYGFDGESCILGGGEENCADGYTWNGEFCQREDELCIGGGGGDGIGNPTVNELAGTPWTVPSGFAADLKFNIKNMEGGYNLAAVELDFYLESFDPASPFQQVFAVNKVGGGFQGLFGLIAKPGYGILNTWDGENSWAKDIVNWKEGEWHHISVNYDVGNASSSAVITDASGAVLGSVSGGAAHTITSTGNVAVVLGGGYEPDKVHAFTGSQYQNVNLVLSAGMPGSCGEGVDLCGILQGGNTPRTDGFTMLPGDEKVDGLCSEVSCNFGHELCGTPTITLTVPDGETCSFSGFIQNDTHVWRNPLTFDIQGNGCAQSITVLECGPQTFDITCGAGSVTFSASESSVLSFASVSEACKPSECSEEEE